MSDMETDQPISDGSRLCLSCGLCCQGIMEKFAVLEPDEIELAKELKLDYFLTEEGVHKFTLPCPMIRETECMIYGSRHPHVCTEFQCILLNRLQNGEISLEESIKIIQKIKKYISLIRERVSSIDKSKSFMDLVQDCWDLQSDPDNELFIDLAAFRYLIFRYMMSPAKPYRIDRLFFPNNSREKRG